MAAEIERKFLLDHLPPQVTAGRGARILQGYLAVEPNGTEVRLRSRGRSHTLTVKSGEGLVREEYEVPLTSRQFAVLWPATAGRRLAKRRYPLRLDGVVAEVDVYEESLSGFMMVEVEFTSCRAARAFRPPPWFGPEVSDHPGYRGRSLARSGVPKVPR